MSFIEKNKVWLLPLLGLGVLGVGYMNFRTLQGEPAAPEAAAPAETPQEPAPVSAPETPAAPAPEGDLWADLQAFALVPGNLSDANRLKDRARLALGAELGAGNGLTLEKPAWSGLSVQTVRPAGTAPASHADPGQVPEPEFLIHGPQGSFAWFAGQAYRAGEPIQHGSYVLKRIGPAYVELSSPDGKVLAFTNPFHATESAQGHHLEAP